MSQITKFEKTLRKNKKIVAVLFVATLLLFIGPQLAANIQLGVSNVINPGFEGAKCDVYGINFMWGSSWTGADTLRLYQLGESNLLTAKGATDRDWTFAGSTTTSTVGWSTFATPNIVGVKGLSNDGGVKRAPPDLFIHVGDLQLQDLTRQGDSLGWEIGTDGRSVTYWRPDLMEATVISETDTTITYSVSATRETFFVAPVDFWVGMGVDASTVNDDRASGWREGHWNDMVVWFRLDFHTWDLAYGDDWAEDAGGEVFDAQVSQYAANYQLVSDYRGGFPIAGWIQGWEKAGWTSYDSDSASPVWFESKGKDEKTLTAEQATILGLKDALMSNVKIAPGTTGTQLKLYSQPDEQYYYLSDLMQMQEFREDDAFLEQVGCNIKAPSSEMQKTMYFPINIQNVGTKVTGDWWDGWTVYYPSVYLHVRLIYGVYGQFTYLWTQEVTKELGEGGLGFPEEFERQGTVIVHTPGVSGWFSGIADWLSSPFSQLWIFFIIIIATVIIITVFNPGVWARLISALKGRQRGERKR